MSAGCSIRLRAMIEPTLSPLSAAGITCAPVRGHRVLLCERLLERGAVVVKACWRSRPRAWRQRLTLRPSVRTRGRSPNAPDSQTTRSQFSLSEFAKSSSFRARPKRYSRIVPIDRGFS